MLYDGTKWTCNWDGENRLIQAEQTPVATDTRKLVYNYDYLGRMYLRTTYKYLASSSYDAGERFGLTYDRWNRIDSQVDWNWLHDEYVWGLDISVTRRGAGGVGSMLMWKGTTDAHTSGSNNYTYYPAYDGNGSVTDLITPIGIAGAHWDYDPFGNILRTLSTPAAGMDPGTYFEFKFSTKPQDRNTGLYYYGYRFYSSATGVWLSRDPVKEKGGVNLTGFIKNDAINGGAYLGLIRFDLDDYPFTINETGGGGGAEHKKCFMVNSDQTNPTRPVPPEYADPDHPSAIGDPDYDAMVEAAGYEVTGNAQGEDLKKNWGDRRCTEMVFYTHGDSAGNLNYSWGAVVEVAGDQ